MGSWLASDPDAPTIDLRFDARAPRRADFGCALLLVVNHICIRVIRVIRAIRGEILILAFPRRAFGKLDRCAKGPRADRALTRCRRNGGAQKVKPAAIWRFVTDRVRGQIAPPSILAEKWSRIRVRLSSSP